MSSLGRVEIVVASRSWPDEFRRIGQDLSACLSGLAVRIGYIGSTSIPGLSAKDVIDVQVTVAALDLDQLAPAFERAGFLRRADNPGFDHRPPGTQGRIEDWAKLYFSPQPGKRVAHPFTCACRVGQTSGTRFSSATIYAHIQPQRPRMRNSSGGWRRSRSTEACTPT